MLFTSNLISGVSRALLWLLGALHTCGAFIQTHAHAHKLKKKEQMAVFTGQFFVVVVVVDDVVRPSSDTSNSGISSFQAVYLTPLPFRVLQNKAALGR